MVLSTNWMKSCQLLIISKSLAMLMQFGQNGRNEPSGMDEIDGMNVSNGTDGIREFAPWPLGRICRLRGEACPLESLPVEKR